MEKAQELEDNDDFEEGEKLLDDMALECDKYSEDPLLKGLKENICKRKKYMTNSKNGINNDCNVKAFNKNICEAYIMQSPKAGFTGDMFQNRTQNVMSKKLQISKKGKY